jgi:hypothetical protein
LPNRRSFRHDPWTLTAKPQGGGYAPKAKLETGVIDCVYLNAGNGQFQSQIAAVGLTPRSTFKEIIDGMTAAKVQADGNGTVPTTPANGTCKPGLVHIDLSGYWLYHGAFTDDATNDLQQYC